MIDCDTARRLIGEGPPGRALQAHLTQCPDCHAEMSFAGEVADAVAALPRQRAPDGLADQVMAMVRERAAASQPEHSITTLLLRPWELVGAGFLCLLAVAAVWTSSPPRWVAPLAGGLSPRWLPQIRIGSDDIVPTIRGWLSGLESMWQQLAGDGLFSGGKLMAWGGGGVAFALALYLLLSVGRRTGVSWGEDAHA